MPFQRRCASDILHGQFKIIDGNQQLVHPSKITLGIKRKLEDLVLLDNPRNKRQKDSKYCNGCIQKVMEFYPNLKPPKQAKKTEHNKASTKSTTAEDAKAECNNFFVINLDHINNLDVSRLTQSQKAMIVHKLVSSERHSISDDAIQLSQMRSINVLAHLGEDYVYLNTINKIVLAFLCGISNLTYPEQYSFLNASESRKIVKCAECCMSLANANIIMPYHFREAVTLYNLTRSRLAIDLLGNCTPCGTYTSLRAWLAALCRDSDMLIPKESNDLLAVFDNNQLMHRRWQITLRNVVHSSVITMVLYFQIDQNGKIQFNDQVKPTNWKWSLSQQQIQNIRLQDELPQIKRCRYNYNLYPYITQIIAEVTSEQIKQHNGTYSDEVDTKVEEVKRDREFKKCVTCKYLQVPKRARTCPNCKESVVKSKLNAAAVGDESASCESESVSNPTASEVRVHVTKTSDDTYKLSYSQHSDRCHPEYKHLTDEHMSNPPEQIIGKPVFVNPCSYDSISIVFRHIGKEAGIEQYGSGTRKWLTVVCDGLPFILGTRIIENMVLCGFCRQSFFGTDELSAHMKECHPQSITVQFSFEFGWLLLQPGPGHVEMQMLKAFVKLTWNIFWEDMVEVFNFKSPNAKASALKVNDHHKGWTLCRIAREALTKELVIPYVRETLASDGIANLSCAGFLKYLMTNVHDPNYGFMADLILEILDAIFMYRAGVRSGNTEMMVAGRAVFAKVWSGKKHPMYNELEMYDSFIRECMPSEVLSFINQTMSLSLSGIQFSGEGADFKLESVNKGIQNSLPPIPRDRDWEAACANYEQLKLLRQAAFQSASNHNIQRPHKPAPNIVKEVLAYRAHVRSTGYLSDPATVKQHTSIKGVPLDKDLVHFCRLTKEKRAKFCDAFVAHYTSGSIPDCKTIKFKHVEICVTQDDRARQDDIANKTVLEIAESINSALDSVIDTSMKDALQSEFNTSVLHKKGKRATKDDYLSFHTILEEYLELEADLEAELEAASQFDNLPYAYDEHTGE